MTGTLSAPGGALAFNAPRGLQRFFAGFFGRNAVAALPGTTAVSGATVRLIEIDSAGVQVGADIAAAVTAVDGTFTLNVPASFAPAPRFVIRAIGTANLERLVTDFTTQDVDPATQVTKTLVLALLQAAGANIQNLQRLQVLAVADQVAALVNDVAPSNISSTMVTDLTAAAQKNEALINAIGNLVAANSVTGTVTDAGGAPLANIKIRVLDFNQWVERAGSVTDASGQYSLNLAAGDYIVGAMNFTAASMAASEWWTCNDAPAGPTCGAANFFSAARVTVGASVTLLNFKLEPGARVEGSITSAANPTTTLPGVQLALRDFTSDQPVAFRDAQAGGTFRVNVRPGVYTVGARNRTLLLPYAGGLYNGPAAGGVAANGGGAIASEATPMTLAVGTTTTVDFPLIEGGVVQGFVTNGAVPPPNAVPGTPVRVWLTTPADTTGAFVEGVRTDIAGGYRLWVRPGTYAVSSRGQRQTQTAVAFSANNNPAAVNFAAAVGHATATMRGPGNTPLSQVKVSVYDSTANAVFQGFEISNGDGSVDIYAQPTGSYRIEYKVDNGSTTVGSAIHDGTATPTQKQLLLATGVAFDTTATTPTALGSITLPAGGELKGVVTVANVPAGNIVVQIRSGGVTGTQRFTSTRTSRDGSYSVSIPAGAYDRVCAFAPGNACAAFAAVTVTAPGSTTLNLAIP
jgi:hypothetical protein